MPADHPALRIDSQRPRDAVEGADSLLRQFERARKGASRWLFAVAAGGIICSGSLSMVLLYAVDSAVGLSLPIRRLLLASWAFAVFLSLMWALRRFLRPIDAATIARAAAGRLPPPRRADFIAAAMLIDDAQRSGWLAVSPTQRTAALRHAAERVGDLPWHRGLSVGRGTTLLTLTWLAVAVAFVAAGNSVFLQRWFAEPLSIAASPDELNFVDLPKHAVEFQDVSIRVQVPEGLPVDRVELSAVGEHGGIEAGPIEPPMGPRGRIRRFVIRDVRTELLLEARCGNFAQTPAIDLPLLRIAKVLSHEFEVTPPEYTGALPFRSRESSLTAVEGSEVALVLRADRKLHSADAAFDRSRPRLYESPWLDSQQTASLGKLSIDDPAADSQTRDVDIAVLDEYNAVHYPDYPLQVRVVRDAPPTVELRPPMTSGGGDLAFAVRGRGSDDFGLRAIDLHLEATDSEAIVLSLFQSSQGPAVKEQDVASGVTYAQLAAAGAAGGALSLWLSAEDIAGQESRSVPYRLEAASQGKAEESPERDLTSVIRRQRLLAAELDRLAAQPILRREDARRTADAQKQLADDLAAAAEPLLSQAEDPAASRAAGDAEVSMRSAADAIQGRQLQTAQAAQRAALASLSEMHNKLTAPESAGESGESAGNASASSPDMPGDPAAEAESWRRWAETQTAINARIDAAAAGGSELSDIAADQARLQAEVREAATAVSEDDRRRWAAGQAVRLQSQVAAGLQRNQVQAPLPQRAALAAAYLKSVAEASEDTSANVAAAAAAAAENGAQGDSPLTSETLGELRVIERMQSQLRSQFDAARTDRSVPAEAMRDYREAQSSLAERLQQIASAAGRELAAQPSATKAQSP